MQTNDLVMKRAPARFTMTGQKLPYDLIEQPDQRISPGLVARLQRYAIERLAQSGFKVDGCKCEVSTMDGDLPPSERYYVVNFVNEAGGGIGVQGIGTAHGHPQLDHGLCINA